MATTDSPKPRKPRTAAQQRAERETTQPVVVAAPTSEELVAEIEKTREDLASTLDEIAEKVSPKRVAKRTGKKVADQVKETAASAKDVVVETAATAKEAAADTVDAARKKVGRAADPVLAPVAPAAPTSLAEALAEEPAAVPGLVPPTDLPPAAAVEVPALSTAWSGPTPVAGSLSGGAPAGRGLPVPAPVLLGVALVGLALLLRRRRRG